MQILLDRNSGISYSRQICEAIIQSIRFGNMKAHSRLLPTRDLAKLLDVSRGTVVKAYEELESSGWVKTRIGDGTYVSDDVGGHGDSRGRKKGSAGIAWNEIFSRFVSDGQSHVLHYLAELVQEPDAINFSTALPPEKDFPVENFRRVINYVIKQDGRNLLQFGPVFGLRSLRDYLSQYLRKRGIFVSEDEILIVNGIQQGLDLTARVFLEPGDPVILETPTYPGVISLMRAFRAHILTLQLHGGQSPIERLRGLVSRYNPKLFYINPSFHNPTGLTLSRSMRFRLMEAAADLNLVIVEDDSTGDLPFDHEPPIPLKALDRENQVIFIGSFSKHLFPGIRMGWIVGEKRVIKNLVLAKATSDLHTNCFDQGVMREFCKRGMFENHIKKMRILYRKKCRIMVKAMEDHFPEGIKWTVPEGGISLWVTLPGEVNSNELFFKAREKGILFTPGNIFHPSGGGLNHLRLNYSRVKSEKIAEGIKILGDLLKEVLDGNKNTIRDLKKGTSPLV